MEILEWLHLLSENVNSSRYNDFVFILYVVASVAIKKSRYLLAFCTSVLAVECSIFDGLQEYQIYLTDFIVYSYVTYHAPSLKIKSTCGIMCLLDLILINDALKYGYNGTHGMSETLIYQNIEYLAFYANIIIIASLLPVGRIYNAASRTIAAIRNVKASSSYLSFFCYNIFKIY